METLWKVRGSCVILHVFSSGAGGFWSAPGCAAAAAAPVRRQHGLWAPLAILQQCAAVRCEQRIWGRLPAADHRLLGLRGVFSLDTRASRPCYTGSLGSLLKRCTEPAAHAVPVLHSTRNMWEQDSMHAGIIWRPGRHIRLCRWLWAGPVEQVSGERLWPGRHVLCPSARGKR